MNARPPFPPFLLAALLCGCASRPVRTELLPFHLAVRPIAIEQLAREPGGTNGDASELSLSFDSESMSKSLVATLQRSFARVTALPAVGRAGPAPEGAALLQQAQQCGADLILDTTLSYDPQLSTELNDRFWLNLPLFALGGPATWFVADRSYLCKVRLEAQLFDLALASAPDANPLDAAARLLRIERQVDETSLNLIDRGSAGHFLLSCVVPASFVGPEAAAVPEEVRGVVVESLCEALASALHERSADLARIARVDFHAEGVRVEVSAGSRHLVGEFVLQLGNVDDLDELRYRLDDGPFVTAAWGEVKVAPPAGRGPASKHYPFKIPLGTATTVQLQVEQQDRSASRRTFTHRVGATPSKE